MPSCFLLKLSLASDTVLVVKMTWDCRMISFAFPTGKISLDNVFQERERLNHNIVGESIV